MTYQSAMIVVVNATGRKIMAMQIQFLGAAGEITVSCDLLQAGKQKILLDYGLLQRRAKDEAGNSKPFPFDPKTIDAVILSHAHIDHSGRIPLLVMQGFRGRVYTHKATSDLGSIMLKDSGCLNEKVCRPLHICILSRMRKQRLVNSPSWLTAKGLLFSPMLPCVCAMSYIEHR